MAEDEWLPILYTGYWDLPRVVCILRPTGTIILDSDFLEEIDDYDPDYVVRLLPPMEPEDFQGSRTDGFSTAPVVGRIPASREIFDETRRATIRRAPLDELGLGEVIDAHPD